MTGDVGWHDMKEPSGDPQLVRDIESPKDTLEYRASAFNEIVEAVAQRTARIILEAILPKIEAGGKLPPRWLTTKSAAAYIDKTYRGMRYTLKQFHKELPAVMIGDKPYFDVKDIDRFMLSRKGR